MTFTPLDPFYVWTPLGKALCTGVYADAEDPQWVTWMVATGEPWWWLNRDIRRAPAVTNALPPASPFRDPNDPLRAHILRYKANGWLPPDFDPTKVWTWPS